MGFIIGTKYSKERLITWTLFVVVAILLLGRFIPIKIVWVEMVAGVVLFFISILGMWEAEKKGFWIACLCLSGIYLIYVLLDMFWL